MQDVSTFYINSLFEANVSMFLELMSWHDANKNDDGMVRLVFDSKAWKHVDNIWLRFATNPWNIRLGLALDGVNPYVDLSTSHSTWQILFLNYNLPP